jgi:sensor histidine kinase YesM
MEILRQEIRDRFTAHSRNGGAAAPFTARVNGYAVLFAAAGVLALVTANECQSIWNFPSLAYGIVLWAWWALVGSALWKLGIRRSSITSFTTKAISAHAAAAAVLGVVHLSLLWGVGYVSLGVRGYKNSGLIWRYLMNLNRYGIEILIYGFIFGMIGIIQHEMRAQREKLKSLELEKQLSAAQLRALQMQLEPHFLFNTLNAITTLVELGRRDEAVEMLGHLNAILKSTLKRTAPEKVPLAQELEIVENYLAIEQVRFADRLRIEIRVEPSALDSLVPCFLLQPIVENAIRHGIAHCESDGLVQASARRDGDMLRLEVRDSGKGLNGGVKPGNGIGLRNTRERLAHFYDKTYDMKAEPLGSGGFAVAIAIPYEPS